MVDIDRYRDAAHRENTRRSYRSALEHFEVDWGGFLPATSESVARYLAKYASTLSPSTLRHRLAALSRWHQEHGFADPTKSLLVRDVLKGARALHPAPPKQARPLEFDALEQVVGWLERSIALARGRDDRPALLRALRDRALVLLGFWRGFRADELTRLRIEHIEVRTGEALRCYLPRSKADRALEGRHFDCPALPKLCPVTAYVEWIAAAGLSEGAVFRKIGRTGAVGSREINPGSLIPLLRRILRAAGVVEAETFSSHSLRRGFAGWARRSGWDVKEMMAYVGWRDVKSAMRYLDADGSSLRERFEAALAPPTGPAANQAPAGTRVELHMVVAANAGGARAARRVTDLITKTCLARYGAHRIDKAGRRYELTLPGDTREALDEIAFALLDELYRLADDNRCATEASIRDLARGWHWS
jgi:integrase